VTTDERAGLAGVHVAECPLVPGRWCVAVGTTLLCGGIEHLHAAETIRDLILAEGRYQRRQLGLVLLTPPAPK